MSYFISAYATSPSFSNWNALLESQYFQALAENAEVVGIEHPYFCDLEKYSLPWLLDNIAANWSLIITALPLSMNEMKKNPYFGLASINEDARKQAVFLMEKISQYIEVLNNKFGKQMVKAVHFHSLPRNDHNSKRGSKAALQRSLYEMQNLDWQNAVLNLEHCDAYIPHQSADKGFLLLEEEIEVLTEVGGNYGIILNWARSAIEKRSVLGPVKHIEIAKKSGLLRGFFFSGCTDNINSDYGFWKDSHMPPKNFIAGKYLENSSLLGKQEIKEILSRLDEDIYLGIKVFDPGITKNLEKSIGLNIETIQALTDARASN